MSIGIHVNKTVMQYVVGGAVSTKSNKNPLRKIGDISTALQEYIDLMKQFDFNKLSAQIFVTGPKSFKETLSQHDKSMIRKIINATDLSLVIHGAYVDNPWNRSQGSIHNIKQEFKIGYDIGASGIIIHLSKGASNDENLRYVLGQIASLPAEILDRITLWLEIHTAKQSQYTYETPQKLKQLFDRLRPYIPPANNLKIGLCIDTAHLYSCGEPLIDAEMASRWLNAIDKLLPDVPKMLHLNDSNSVCGSGIDIHAPLTKGNIWGIYNEKTGQLHIEKSGLAAILRWAESNNINVILEREPKYIKHDLRLIESMGFFRK